MQPLVSVVTPTWQRHADLTALMADLQDQDYPNLEHIVVSDGPDLWIEERWPRLRDRRRLHNRIDQRYASLGRNWSGLMPESFGVAPLTVGYLMACGEYIMHLSDDDRISPGYISRLVALLDETGADFAYTKARFYWHDQRPEDGYDIGTDPPAHGQITSYLFRPYCLRRFGMPRWGSHPMDWSLISDWMAAGAQWAFLPEVLFRHRADDESGRAR